MILGTIGASSLGEDTEEAVRRSWTHEVGDRRMENTEDDEIRLWRTVEARKRFEENTEDEERLWDTAEAGVFRRTADTEVRGRLGKILPVNR